eukprot:TRINITY_DN2477_c0_g1_i1.p1 TRINITY_DN2477_c0_g1~~TRINITY_DN2477_c0_g1_i1.p1  ORF type:complete len:172 (+),score=38.71 TRINITY_DN2477_c0_g1_i1:47-517(+)
MAAVRTDQQALAKIAEEINSKLQPDIVFSLERTLSAWMSLGSYMFLTGLGLIAFGEVVTAYVGYVLSPLGIIFNLWSFWVYYTRLVKLEGRKPLDPTGNRIPVALFTFSFVVVMCLTIIFAAIFTATERVDVNPVGNATATNATTASSTPSSSPTP